jgi:hypothetical protein
MPKTKFSIPCPECETLLDSATSVAGDDATPKPGDITLCIYCGMLLEFTESGLKLISDEALDDLPTLEISRGNKIRAAFLRRHPEKKR